MLAIPTSSTTKSKTLQPNILPCQIHHSGPISIAERYWNPQPNNNTTATSPPTQQSQPPASNEVTQHFRGRKLLGKTINLPSSYTGIVAQKTNRQIQIPHQTSSTHIFTHDAENDEEDEEQSLPTETFILEQQAEFNTITTWDHEKVPSSEEDVYIKGIEEWIGFAESIHAYDTPKTAAES
ncbi:hypothetical protein CB0940_06738 [Cercospora beticola]|uniref:Uncharacterized protein n=1 Tax=Cercospora beticola TaxID=122368 RepID=A0A2G5H9C3_CERBT|nr:hypothetical protein CB0940_06738 [Cercospora beticola]PIA89129.1 hypothetical protein CB0940_06738 [Cercospora beticola]WPB02647.1 hypothetical protein RHO25_007283 [Cercospora beticola]CAK1358685.1 unnamed protein product [Cercospora beticola]